MKMIKPILVILLIVVLVLAGARYLFMVDQQQVAEETFEAPSVTTENLINTSKGPFQHYLDNISSGGPPKDGIPPIETPTYVSIDHAATSMDAYDKVFVFEGEEEVYLYPQSILVWHEIVNDVIDNQAISITYCPLTGSTICYEGTIDNYENNTYGTSGKLLNSNLVMYDRATDSYIPQILGIGINGKLEGISLNTLPIHWSTWENAIDAYPDAKVLSMETGFLRDYTRDPYGTYQPEDNKSYYANDGVIFPLMHQHKGLYSDKKVVIGVKHQDNSMAIDPVRVQKDLVVNFSIGDIEAVALWDSNIKTVRVYSRDFEGALLDFESSENNYTDQFNRIWSTSGKTEDGMTLSTITYFDVMWFAWYAYYPETEVIQ